MGRQKKRAQQRRARTQQQQQRPHGSRFAPQPRKRAGLGMGTIISGIGAIVLLAAVLGYAATHANGSAAPAGPTPTSISLAPAIDGVGCNAMENLVYHIHQHLTLYDHGKLVPVPSAIGMPGGELNAQCFYWIHVHAAYPDIIHVESPIKKTYTLGDFFDIWQATKDSTTPPGDTFVRDLKAAAAQGQAQAYVNGVLWAGSYRDIPLKPYAVITIEAGKPTVKPKPFNNWQGL